MKKLPACPVIRAEGNWEHELIMLQQVIWKSSGANDRILLTLGLPVVYN
jgi:hypothetical protein